MNEFIYLLAYYKYVLSFFVFAWCTQRPWATAVVQLFRAVALHAEDRLFVPGCDAPKSLNYKQALTAPLTNATQQVWMSWVFGNEAPKWYLTILTAQWPRAPNICLNLQPFSSNDEFSLWVKKCRKGRKTTHYNKRHIEIHTK